MNRGSAYFSCLFSNEFLGLGKVKEIQYTQKIDKLRTTLVLLLLSMSSMLLSQEICDNGIDDDGDTLIDLNDDECQCTDVRDLTKNIGSICRDNLRLELDVPGATSWQWYKDGIAIVGENSSEIILAEIAGVEGIYVIRVETPSGCVTSIPYDLVIPSYFVDLGEEYICDGGCIQFGPFTICSPGFFQNNGPAADGCDSMTVLEVFEFQKSFGSLKDTICQGDTYDLYDLSTTTGGIHEATTQNYRGCDSVITVELAVLDQIERVITAEICDGETYTYRDISETTEGMYSTIVSNANSCDSLIIVNLDVLQNTSSSLDATICRGETYSLHGISETETGVYMTTITNAASCDSTIAVNLEVLEPSTFDFDHSICEGDTYNLHSISASTAGIYSTTITNTVGCDSIITVDLSIGGEVLISMIDTICEGEIYIFKDINTSVAGTYTTITSNQGVCDSIITVELIVGTVTTSDIQRSICDGEFFVFNDIVTDQPGMYQTIVESRFGCDSIINIELMGFQSETETLVESVCPGDTFRLEDIIATESGSYTTILQTVNGCDSMVMVDLTVQETPERIANYKICDGDVFTFDNQEISQSGEYEFVVTSTTGGCDSLITLFVETVNPDNLISLSENELQLNQGNQIDIIPSFIDPSVETIEWTDEDGNILSTDDGLLGFSPEISTYLEVTVVDENGCSETEFLFVEVDIFVNIFIPNVFTPNGDDVNDRFSIFANNSVDGIEKLVIFDRWGEPVFADAHEGDLGRYVGWDGTFKGRPVVQGVYSYSAVFSVIDGSQVNRSGSFTIMR